MSVAQLTSELFGNARDVARNVGSYTGNAAKGVSDYTQKAIANVKQYALPATAFAAGGFLVLANACGGSDGKNPNYSPSVTATPTAEATRTPLGTYDPTATPVSTQSATATPTQEPTLAPTKEPTQAPTATPINSRFDNGFYLTSPCSVECELRDQNIPGYNVVEAALPEGSDILYAGEEGYYSWHLASPSVDIVNIFDNSGYVLTYIVTKGNITIPQGPITVSRGQKIAIAGPMSLSYEDSTTLLELKFFPETILGGPELNAFLETPFLDLYANDFPEN